MTEKQISVTGVVQGVGFRPFVYGLANRLDLHGWVCNTSAGVEIVVQGQNARIERFIHSLETEAPPLARIESIQVYEACTGVDYPAFDILPSAIVSDAYQPISPDIAICPDCERELFDPKDRRYLYPFINCTNCGPRFTIIKDIPYDRPATTMADFDMCDDCRKEYEDPRNRRFHAQPIACPKCGPFVEMRTVRPTGKLGISSIEYRTSAILKIRRLLREGHIVAVKGLGGFHLACDASNDAAVQELRHRKGRAGKPFALMAADLETVHQFCAASEEESSLLAGLEKPIVLLKRKNRKGAGEIHISDCVAPRMDALGVMLPYTPLHHLLLNQTDPVLAREPSPLVLVMTSGNFSEEPIVTDNETALGRFASLADALLLHDREIHVRCDDSVVRINHQKKEVEYLRRSRGYAPYPIHLPFETWPTLAVGGELKNAFCLTREQHAFPGPYIGDMENAETFEAFAQGVRHLEKIFHIKPELIAHDLHPNYFTTQYARAQNQPLTAVQHHHAHIASCMADNGVEDGQWIGLSFDGTGYGTDGAIWGGEVLLASYADFERLAHLEYLPLPGSDSAIRHPWRIAVGYAHALGIELDDLPFLKHIESPALQVTRQQVDKNLNAPPTSSMGRLFDAVASLANICTSVTYEAQAAMEMEVLSRPFIQSVKSYPYQAGEVVPLKETLRAVVDDVRRKELPGMIGARFHKTIAALSVDLCRLARVNTHLNEVALSGGVWQNQILLHLVRDGLEKDGFTVYVHRHVPANDGGLALGQAAVANHRK